MYANSRIKMQLEAGPRHPLVSHWSGKKGAEPLLIRISSNRNPHTTRLEAGPSRPTLAHWTEEKGA